MGSPMTVLVAVSITDTGVAVDVGDVDAGAVGADRHADRAVADGDGVADDGVGGGVDHRHRAGGRLVT